MRTCPICGKDYIEYPALSRKDNETEICPDCGMLEALDNWCGYQESEGEWWIFTFGCGQEHAGCYVKIKGSYEEARKKMFNKYGAKWAFQYSLSDWIKTPIWVRESIQLEVIE